MKQFRAANGRFRRQEQLRKSLRQAILVPDDQLANLDRNKVQQIARERAAMNSESTKKGANGSLHRIGPFE